ncbi:MAG: Tol-Pal system subunit TolQ, partial [Sphingomonadales bacterium]
MMQEMAVAASNSALSPIGLFLQADIVVKSVMIGLLLASVWTWTIIVSGSMSLARAYKSSKGFEADFWKSEDIDKFYEGAGRHD